MLHTLDVLVTDFSTAVAALSASGKIPSAFSFTSNVSTPRGPRRMRNPIQAPPFMTAMRGDDVLVFSLAMCVSPKEGASPEGDAVMSSLRSDRVREFAALLHRDPIDALSGGCQPHVPIWRDRRGDDARAQAVEEVLVLHD